MMKLVGDIAYFAAIVGINFVFVFLLTLTQWRKDFLSAAWTAFFLVVAVILDLSGLILFVESWRPFVLEYVRTPLYIALAVSVWTLAFASIDSAVRGKKRRGSNKVDVIESKE